MVHQGFCGHRTIWNTIFSHEVKISRGLKVFSFGPKWWFPFVFTIGNYKGFQKMKSIFRWTTYSWRMKLIFSGSVVPMSTTDWWNMSFQLSRFSEIRGLKYFRFNWKFTEHHCKLLSHFGRSMGKPSDPSEFWLRAKKCVSSGSMAAKSLSHHGPSIRSQNMKCFGAV